MDYKNGKIYMIRSKCGPEYYIGSTAYITLSQRFTKHKTKFNCGKINETSKILFEKYGVENCYIELLEAYPCNSKTELEAREGYYHRKHWQDENLVNHCMYGRTPKEYNDEYYKVNKEIINNKHKKYYQTNKTEICIKSKEYYEQNKSKISEYRSQIVTCECGHSLTLHHLARHKKSQKHHEELNKKLLEELPLI